MSFMQIYVHCLAVTFNFSVIYKSPFHLSTTYLAVPLFQYMEGLETKQSVRPINLDTVLKI